MSYVDGLNGLQQAAGSVAATTSSVSVPRDNIEDASTPVTNAESAIGHLDKTDLSATAGSIVHALASSDVRMSKVAALQQTIASGSYNVSSADVAGKVIQSLLRP